MKLEQLRVATLNYSGIITSPYEYYEEALEGRSKLSDNFSQIVRKYHDPNFEDPAFCWDMGNVDVIWKTRYSPLHFSRCGVKLNSEGHEEMMNLHEFEAEWDNRAQEGRRCLQDLYATKFHTHTAQKNAELVEKHIKNTRIFDILAYRTMIFSIYGTEDIENLKEGAGKWFQEREKDFSKPYLDEGKKMQLTLKELENTQFDIFCMQETNQPFRKLLNQKLGSYWIRAEENIQSCSSIIALKKSSFPEIKSQADMETLNSNFLEEHCKLKAVFASQHPSPEANQQKSLFETHASQSVVSALKESLTWNRDSVMQVVGELIIFSPHISSKKELNPIQLKKIIEDIKDIKKYNPEYSIICAGDLNTQIKENFSVRTAKDESREMNIFPPPGSKNYITCNKKRTLIQPQRHKAEKQDLGTKDYVITDLPLLCSKVMTIDQQEITAQNRACLLPSSSHPYDHYLVTCTLGVDK